MFMKYLFLFLLFTQSNSFFVPLLYNTLQLRNSALYMVNNLSFQDISRNDIKIITNITDIFILLYKDLCKNNTLCYKNTSKIQLSNLDIELLNNIEAYVLNKQLKLFNSTNIYTLEDLKC